MEIAVALLFLTVAVIVTFWPTASVVGVIEQEVMVGSDGGHGIWTVPIDE